MKYPTPRNISDPIIIAIILDDLPTSFFYFILISQCLYMCAEALAEAQASATACSKVLDS